ncbi:MAG TPA: hypothetical protein VH986_02495 [Acidimicrobiia bacterium]|jgi:hypothetical protein
MDITDAERDLLLAGLFELHLARPDDDEQAHAISALVVKLGGAPDTAFFGAYRHADGSVPAPEYPADESDEG